MRFADGEAILGLARNFMEPRVLLTATELDLFSQVAREPGSAADLAERIGASERGLTMLLDALVSMGLLAKRQGTYHGLEELAPYLTADSPTSILPMLQHSAGLWERWSSLTAVVKGEPVTRRPGGFNADSLRAFIGAMHNVAGALAESTAQIVAPEGARRLLDIGGASGSYTIAFLRAAPALRATLFDQPPVVEMARERLTAEGLADRVELVAGDFYSDNLPAGHDLALLSAIIHQNSREQNVALYRKVYAALEPGGRLIVRDHIMSHDHTQPLAGALFAINMLVGTPGGGTYTLAEITEDLTAAGFTAIRQLREDRRMEGLVEATRPR